MKILNSLYSSRLCRKILENPKTGCSRESLLPANDFKTCSAVNSTKHLYFEGLETSQRLIIQEWSISHIPLHISYKNCFGHSKGSSKYASSGTKFIKISWNGWKVEFLWLLYLYFFEVSILKRCYLTGGNSWCVIGKKKIRYSKLIEKSIWFREASKWFLDIH